MTGFTVVPEKRRKRSRETPATAAPIPTIALLCKRTSKCVKLDL